ncbi:hypothetical protein DC20_02085 [Rufibacter tibetensis]|uniref:Uncharacterized protein n=1 Tax=Rufibacter tibetensis TaxID=512763 RepID=A0A0P0CP12_9BACT|nr:hypothetical protein DC20_02085 [Rufibacter tibetensis]
MKSKVFIRTQRLLHTLKHLKIWTESKSNETLSPALASFSIHDLVFSGLGTKATNPYRAETLPAG